MFKFLLVILFLGQVQNIEEYINPAPPVNIVKTVKVITMYTADWCSACKVWEATNKKTFESNGFIIKKVYVQLPTTIKINNSNIIITSIPFFVVEYENSKQWFKGSNFSFKDFLNKKQNK
mgnify:CR=1 FL=1